MIGDAPLDHQSQIFNLIGNTPLLDLTPLTQAPAGVRLLAKAEWLNPGGSIKDRPVAAMLQRALKDGELNNNRILLDSSSGNSAIAYAMLGAALGLPVTMVLPGNASDERKRRILAHGAKIIETDPLEGYDEALRAVKRLATGEPERYFYCDQYSNPENWQCHYRHTAGELLRQAGRPITHFVAGVGTGGSFTGIARRLKEAYPGLRALCVRFAPWPGIEGLKPLGHPGDIVPAIFDDTLVDDWIDVTADDARFWCHRLASQGYFVGQSSGAYLAACAKVIKGIDRGLVTTLLCDLGERYVSAGLWEGS